jgi:hypothetical protein
MTMPERSFDVRCRDGIWGWKCLHCKLIRTFKSRRGALVAGKRHECEARDRERTRIVGEVEAIHGRVVQGATAFVNLDRVLHVVRGGQAWGDDDA